MPNGFGFSCSTAGSYSQDPIIRPAWMANIRFFPRKAIQRPTLGLLQIRIWAAVRDPGKYTQIVKNNNRELLAMNAKCLPGIWGQRRVDFG
jgi:hypothetical protein